MKKQTKTILGVIAIATLGGFSSLTLYKMFEDKPLAANIQTPQNQTILTSNSAAPTYSPILSFENAAELSVNTVVHIKTEALVQQTVDPLYQFFYGRNYQQAPQHAKASGSGVLISDDGYIVTNNHVIDKADKISVTLNDKNTYEAELIGKDPNTDLALLKINGEDFPHINYGNSNNVNIGEWVLAVGNPYNLTSTVTAGIVSAKGRDINILKSDPYSGSSAIESFIQTDAAVNPGNSGGALVNTKGELIGINSAIQSNTGSYSGYSFAIPVNIVKKVVADLKEFGTVQRAYIGVSISNINDEIASEIGEKDLNGVYISSITQGGAAQKAGIKAKDIIRKIGTKSINDVPELQEQISQFRPGEKVNITIERDDELLEITLILKNMSGDEAIVSNNSTLLLEKLGAKFTDIKKSELKNLHIKSGVKVDQLYNGKLRMSGIRKDFIITQVNQQDIANTKHLLSILSKIDDGVLIEGIYPNGKKEFYGFGMK